MTKNAEQVTYGFDPDWAIAPGETISECLEESEITVNDLAGRSGLGVLHVEQLLTGDAHITPTIASKLEQVLGGSAEFWMAREINYRRKLIELSARGTTTRSGNLTYLSSGS